MTAQLPALPSKERLQEIIDFDARFNPEVCAMARALLAGMEQPEREETTITAVADMYRIGSPENGTQWECTHNASDAHKAKLNGYDVTEFVTLERYVKAVMCNGTELVAVPDEQYSERFDWSYEDWANHLGDRHQNNDPA